MVLKDGLKTSDIPAGEFRTYANEDGLNVLASLVRVVSDQLLTVNGRPVEAVIAEAAGLEDPESHETQNKVLELLDHFAEVLPLTVKVDYVRPGSALLETGSDDNSAAETPVA